MNRKLAATVINWLGETDVCKRLVTITHQAIAQIKHPRFWETERGFHGEFHAVLREILISERIIAYAGPILEQEYQKSRHHGISQRPDSILHLPANQWGLKRNEGNFAVWALKYRSSESEATADFRRLNEMFTKLKYPLGFFINVDSERTFEDVYRGGYAERVHCISCRLNADGTLFLGHAQPNLTYSVLKQKSRTRALKSRRHVK